MTAHANSPSTSAGWRLDWSHGRAQVQALGAMLGPLTFRFDDGQELQVMHVAPWADAAAARDAAALPGILQRLRGEWPCVPFGRTDLPPDLPPDWQALGPNDGWPHGFGSNNLWTCTHADAGRLSLAIDYPNDAQDATIARLERHLHAVPGAPAVDIELVIHPRANLRLPAGLHPTFRIPTDGGGVALEPGAHDGVFTYPSRSAGAISPLLPDRRADTLRSVAADGGPLDLTRLPLAADGEALLQVRAPRPDGALPPFALHYRDAEARVGLWWDTAQFPDLMLWVSNRGRPEFPWDGRHVALGAEPVNSVFDLGRVARPPADHPLADRTGIVLEAGQAWRTRYRIGAWQGAAPAYPWRV